jgi:hypothetical protein
LAKQLSTSLYLLALLPPSGNQGDSTPVELFMAGVKGWETGIQRLLVAEAVCDG